MKTTTNTIRRLATIAVAAALAAFAAPVASAGDRIVDDWFRDAPVAQSNQATDLLVDDWFRDYVRGTHFASQPGAASNLNYLYRRSVALNDLHHGGQPAQIAAASGISTEDGFDLNNIEIGIVVAACGLLLLVALGIGARQVRHTRHRLGSA